MVEPICEHKECVDNAELLISAGERRLFMCRKHWDELKVDMVLLDFGLDEA